MIDEWKLAAAGPAVLVTVAIAEGSVPRGPGTRMMVAPDRFAGTVGGGHLELRAIEIGRAMLIDGRQRHFERFPLGPSLGQCCGGVVHLAFEQCSAADAALLDGRRGQDSWRLVAFDGAADAALFDGDGKQLAGAALFDGDGKQLAGAGGGPGFDRGRDSHMMATADGRRWLVAKVAAPRNHLLLFGAGHVGAALVRALAELPCTVTWIDERAALFPAEVPANVTIEATDAPQDLVAHAPDGASYLVMTHSHALDQAISEAILAREQVGWFGLIGSKTKRMQFEHRLRARGVAEQRIAAMACPIGLPGIGGKEPAVIAVAVAAQLLMLWQSAAHTELAPPTIRLVGSAT
ncbi:MAG TPA: xanthine dehydrogenase accessory protein XdhC [Telluria sp.]|nr:xanthine dehydrogenase accessory protein XdhC [Telluria sp.]